MDQNFNVVRDEMVWRKKATVAIFTLTKRKGRFFTPTLVLWASCAARGIPPSNFSILPRYETPMHVDVQHWFVHKSKIERWIDSLLPSFGKFEWLAIFSWIESRYEVTEEFSASETVNNNSFGKCHNWFSWSRVNGKSWNKTVRPFQTFSNFKK